VIAGIVSVASVLVECLTGAAHTRKEVAKRAKRTFKRKYWLVVCGK
jgi:hypothetical protein